MNTIQWIIDPTTYWVKNDGYTMHITTITNVKTGKSVSLDECEGNVRGYINAANKDNQVIHTSPDTHVMHREYKRLYKHLPVVPIYLCADALAEIKRIGGTS